MLCILYVTAVGTLLGVVGLLAERLLPPTFPRRWVWCVIIPISLFLPGLYRAHHTVTVIEVQQAVQPPLGNALGTGSLAALDPAWWAHMESYDSAIQRLWLAASALLLLWGLASAWRVSRASSPSRTRRGGNRRWGSGRRHRLDGACHRRIVAIAGVGPALGTRHAGSAAKIRAPPRGRASAGERRAPPFRGVPATASGALESRHVVAAAPAVPGDRDGLR